MGLNVAVKAPNMAFRNDLSKVGRARLLPSHPKAAIPVRAQNRESPNTYVRMGNIGPCHKTREALSRGWCPCAMPPSVTAIWHVSARQEPRPPNLHGCVLIMAQIC